MFENEWIVAQTNLLLLWEYVFEFVKANINFLFIKWGWDIPHIGYPSSFIVDI